MLFILPVTLMFLVALALLVVSVIRPNFKYPWLLAAGGAMLAFISVFLWRIRFPQSVTLPFWQAGTSFLNTPAWLIDGISWPFALTLATLAMAVVWTSVVRSESKPISWSKALTLTALGILAITAENPLSLILSWSAMDLFELFTVFRSAEGKSQTGGVVIFFSIRIIGSGLVLWANLISLAVGTPLDFRSITQKTGLYLLIAAVLRLGVLLLHLPYRQENVDRRGFGTALWLVSAASSLALLARIPATALKFVLTPHLLILTAIVALFAGWKWLNASDEIQGRPFWILGFASLAIAESLRGNPTGSASWGIAMVLCGGMLFLFSSRRKNILWLPFLGLLGFSTLPFSLTSPAWNTSNSNSWIFVIPFLPAQALLLAGFLRQVLRPGEASLESQKEWSKVIYPAGLLVLIAVGILLGFWGWVGARVIGSWWLTSIVILLAAGFVILAMKFPMRIPSGNFSNRWTHLFRVDWLYHALGAFYGFLRRIIDIITLTFEGEGGLLWSFLLLVLILSVLSTSGH